MRRINFDNYDPGCSGRRGWEDKKPTIDHILTSGGAHDRHSRILRGLMAPVDGYYVQVEKSVNTRMDWKKCDHTSFYSVPSWRGHNVVNNKRNNSTPHEEEEEEEVKRKDDGHYEMEPDLVIAPTQFYGKACVIEVTTLVSTGMAYMKKEDPITFVEKKKRTKYASLERPDKEGNVRSECLYFTQDVWGAGGEDNWKIIDRLSKMKKILKGGDLQTIKYRLNKRLGYGLLLSTINSIHRAGKYWEISMENKTENNPPSNTKRRKHNKRKREGKQNQLAYSSRDNLGERA